MIGTGSQEERIRSNVLTLAGVAGVCFYLVYVVRSLQNGQLAGGLWACHLASFLAGAGILLLRPALVAIGVLWLLVGTPLWFVYLLNGGTFRPESMLTHLGGLAVGFYGLRALGMSQRVWWKAIGGLLILLAVSRCVTPPALNVNLAYHVYQSRDPFVGYHSMCLVCLTLMSTVVFAVAERLLGRIFPLPCAASEGP